MIKKFLPALAFIILSFSTSSIAFATNSAQDNISKSRIKLQQMNENLIGTNKQMSDLNTEMNKLTTDIGKNKVDINEVEKQIKAEKIQTEKLTKQVKSNQQLANKRLKAIYINGYGENFLQLLLTSQSFSDFCSKYEVVKSIMCFDKKTFNDLEAKKKTISDSISKLDLKNKHLQQLKTSNIARATQLNDNKKKLQALTKQFNEEKNSAAAVIKENEEKLIAHATSVIASQGSTAGDVKNALQTLNSLYSQLSTASVKKKAMDSIDSGNKKLSTLTSTGTNVNTGGSDKYKATYTMTATAYTGGGLTTLGLKPSRNAAGLSTIAVDPNVIPLGTKVYIPSYGYAICSDTGGLINGNIIDLYMNSDEDCNSWGRKTVTLYIVAYPGEW